MYGGRTLDLGLDIVDGVRRLHLKGDSLTRKGLDEDLHLCKGLYKLVTVHSFSRRGFMIVRSRPFSLLVLDEPTPLEQKPVFSNKLQIIDRLRAINTSQKDPARITHLDKLSSSTFGDRSRKRKSGA